VIRSSSLRALFCLGGAFAVAAPLAGCVVAAVGGAAAGGYTLVTEERTPQQLAQDASIGAVAHKNWSDANVELARDLTATVYDGRLLITGIVPNAAMKDQAEELARKVDGVKEIHNEVEVGQPTNIAQDARDNVVSNTLRTQLLTDSDVRSSNFIVHTMDGVLYIMGYARNAPERDRVLAYARNLANVKRVVYFIRVGDQAPANAPASGTSAPASGANTPASDSMPVGAPTPRDTIEVTPLK
jgi:osmotically-inducible protein OsmY